ncbi:MAG TPA: hypothetical protein GXZ96_04360 [Firmicutes bacterium]|nr:hypothetical protein [Bacillota bacterium]
MKPMGTGVLLLEGGSASGEVDSTLQALRRAIAMDTLINWLTVPGTQVVLASGNRQLLQAAEKLGAGRYDTGGGPFRLLDTLRAVLQEQKWQRVLCMGGAAAPLATRQDLTEILGMLQAAPEPAVLMNNPLSADIVGFSPTSCLAGIQAAGCDNDLAFQLCHIGLRRVLLPPEPRLTFDLDTPSDALLLQWLVERGQPVGERTRQALAGLPWDGWRLQAAVDVLARPGCEVALLGRVGPGVVSEINQRLQCRLRVFSEERGMKALGRLASRSVTSLLGHYYQAVGGAEFFRALGQVADVAFFDTRVLLAHLGCYVEAEQRFCSDLGWWREITHPGLREFTRLAWQTEVPVVLGGHSLVSGGLRLLVATLPAGRERNSPE